MTIAQTSLTPGVYKLDGRLYAVKPSRYYAGRQNIKRLEVRRGKLYRRMVTFDVIDRLRQDMHITLEDAVAFGEQHHFCCMCGRSLTREDSIAKAIGPVCEKRIKQATATNHSVPLTAADRDH
ncbi:DUF6011 domain-containing protein [Nonomuraea sp. NPDC050394]|uniref:DUF6011 domain-containing protein n=1 Tax=Nonomuraea sp. NPDC050394 TaxID=3364363 RepID=UPI0037B641C6